MKTLRLAISRILTYFSENKTIFVLYFIGTISCVIMMIYYYGNTLNYMTGNSSFDDIEFRKYHVAFSSPTEVTEDTIEKLKEFEQKYGIQDIELTTIIDLDGNNIEFSSNDEAINDYWLKKLGNRDSSDTDKKYIILSTYLNNNEDNSFSDTKGRLFTDEELSKNVASVSLGKAKSIKVGNTTFNVVKEKTAQEEFDGKIEKYYIPADAYFKTGIKTWTVDIVIKERFSQNMMYRYVNYLRDVFNIKFDPAVDNEGSYDYVRGPIIYYIEDANQVSSQFYSIVYIFMLSLISFMFLLKYLMDSSRRENSILMMVGAKKRLVMLVNFIENVALTVISTVIAIAIHILLYSSVFSKANLYENIKYSAQDYAIIDLLAIGLSIIVQIPFIFTYWFKNVRNIKEGSK